jgi:hypothetical protein
MADEDLVLDGDALADERVARDLAPLADGGVLLDFDERADLRVVADTASVEIDEIGESDTGSQLDVVGNRHEGSIRYAVFESSH